MSAEVLRRAANLMREQAEAATDSPWVVKRAHPDMPAYVAHEGWWVIASRTEQWDAEHIASWHPAVALAVADWLDRLHAFITDFSEYDEDEELSAALRDGGDLSDWPEVESALAVARAYLGSDA